VIRLSPKIWPSSDDLIDLARGSILQNVPQVGPPLRPLLVYAHPSQKRTIIVLLNDQTLSYASSSSTPSWLGGKTSVRRTRGHCTTLGRVTIRFVPTLSFSQASVLLNLPTQVLGVPGEDLNYEETVVYNNDAVRPAFLIVYGDAPPVPPKPMGARNAVKKLFTTPLVS